ncbi:hypothetical protein QWI17_15735 [Gilvimarinus sp. SDUM040013]|uniref:Uncharacterized protein n=1 Tax=Gilvimarinus gilvus TaxID=3058038 RepID=A0ABU4RXV5_9GAMM|nr:hypothetical protein [Gilvimarinus sp. SDUM040013]MDO3387292.1 hypothetical protein [Gilvimarinus sp. SDUM040013]MDX6848981.1 hypothetical protein [Gilvimarinus sp. SDUM040013]
MSKENKSGAVKAKAHKRDASEGSVKLQMDGYRGVKMDLSSLGNNRAVQRQAMYVQRLLKGEEPSKA